MEDNFENKLSMYRSVETLLDNNTTKTAGITVFATRQAEFKDVVAAIIEKEENRINATKGLTAEKRKQRNEMILDASIIAAKLKTLAADTNDERLKELSNYKKSHLKEMRDTQLLPIIQGLINTADSNSADLANYGVTAVMIADLSTKQGIYNSALGAKAGGFNVKGAALTALRNLFKSADSILKDKIDNLMEGFVKDDNEFYNQYKNARVIYDLGVRHEKEEPTPPPVEPVIAS